MSDITVTPFLWFDDNAEQAIERYKQVFPDTEVVEENRHPDGSLFIGTIRVKGTTLTLMNGGPHFTLSDAFSLAVSVETQEEVETISDALIDGGGAQSQCGWLVDAFGLSWQIVPATMFRLFADPDREAAGRAQAAMMQMNRLSIQGLQDAFDGKA